MKKYNKSELGRSMVEMLGVLAIIGVLSVGGIAGYKTAMTKIETNNALRILDLFVLSMEEAQNNDSCTGYDQPNSAVSTFEKATRYFCDAYLGGCSNYDFVAHTDYAGATYNNLNLFVMTAPPYTLMLHMPNLSPDACKAVTKSAYNTYFDLLEGRDHPTVAGAFRKGLNNHSKYDLDAALADCDIGRSAETTSIRFMFDYRSGCNQ